MHQTNRPLIWLAGVIVGLGLAANQYSTAEDPPAANQNQAQLRAAVFVVPLDATRQLSMNPRRPIRKVINEKEFICSVHAIEDDRTAVSVFGRQAGKSRVLMIDEKGVEETVDVVVELDVDAVRTVLRRAFPTAQVEPIPTGSRTIVLVGNVAHAEEIEAILRVAQGVLVNNQGAAGATQIVNAMTVGGVRQVQLDVVIASVNRSELRQFGVNFAVAGSTVPVASTIGNLVNNGTAQATGNNGGAGFVVQGVGRFISTLTPTSNTNIVAGIVPAQMNTFIQALRQERIAKLLAEPRLITLSGRPATFLSGGQQAVPQVTGGGTSGGVVGTQFEPFGTSLTFLPIVYGNGKIYLEVEPSVSILNAANGFAIGGTIVQGRDEQRVRTSVMMEPGQTFAIGGLIQTATNGVTNKVPVLGDIPFIGPAFSTISYEDQERELVVLVTPYLVDAMDCRQAPCKLPGLETRTPDDFELFLELILEAPRGQREVFPNKKYKAAWLNDPSASQFPCGGGACETGACGTSQAGCATCNQPATANVIPAQSAAPAQQTTPAGQQVVPAGESRPAEKEMEIAPPVTLPAREGQSNANGNTRPYGVATPNWARNP